MNPTAKAHARDCALTIAKIVTEATGATLAPLASLKIEDAIERAIRAEITDFLKRNRKLQRELDEDFEDPNGLETEAKSPPKAELNLAESVPPAS